MRLHAFLAQGRALLDTETMLFIHHGHRQLAKCHAPLDQGVCADGDVGVARGQGRQGLGPLSAAHGAGQQDHFHRPIGAGMGYVFEHFAERARHVARPGFRWGP